MPRLSVGTPDAKSRQGCLRQGCSNHEGQMESLRKFIEGA